MITVIYWLDQALDKEIYTYISKYLSGNCTPEEKKILNKWMSQDPANCQVVKDLEHIWEQAPKGEFELNTSDAWIQFKANRKIEKQKSDTQGYFSKKANMPSFLFKAAAIFLLVACIGLLSWQILDGYENGPGEDVPYAMQKISTKKGEKAQVTFSDGTKAILNVASSLRFSEGFSGTTRDVYLDGEAYFNVAPNKEMPFVVHTKNASISVLGTKFNVQAWKEDQESVVGVHEGKVKVSANGNDQKRNRSVLITKGKFATVKNGKSTSYVAEDINDLFLWVDGGLYFNKVPFAQAIRQIERKFDVNISIEKTHVANVPFTGTFKNAELEEILHVLSVSMDLDYVQKESEIIFST